MSIAFETTMSMTISGNARRKSIRIPVSKWSRIVSVVVIRSSPEGRKSRPVTLRSNDVISSPTRSASSTISSPLGVSA